MQRAARIAAKASATNMNDYADIPVFLRRKRTEAALTPHDMWIAALVFGICVTATVVYFLVPTPRPAHADESLHTNAWYCAHLQNYTNSDDPKIVTYCASL